jgi:hypothetical protein
VKWLTEIRLTGRPFRGYFQVERYHIDGDGVTVQRVRSLITEPAPGQAAGPGDIVIRGVAWSGLASIAKVEVSIDHAPWQLARLVGDRHPHGWRCWELPVRLTGPGQATIRARATDQAGRTQPDRPQWNPLGYANHAIQEVRLNSGPGTRR